MTTQHDHIYVLFHITDLNSIFRTMTLVANVVVVVDYRSSFHLNQLLESKLQAMFIEKLRSTFRENKGNRHKIWGHRFELCKQTLPNIQEKIAHNKSKVTRSLPGPQTLWEIYALGLPFKGNQHKKKKKTETQFVLKFLWRPTGD